MEITRYIGFVEAEVTLKSVEEYIKSKNRKQKTKNKNETANTQNSIKVKRE